MQYSSRRNLAVTLVLLTIGSVAAAQEALRDDKHNSSLHRLVGPLLHESCPVPESKRHLFRR